MEAAVTSIHATQQPLRQRWLGPVAMLLCAVAMAWWSWGTWPDPLVDFGTHCYVPWRLSAGQVLYRDIAYYNGPLSAYANALLFRVAGVGIDRLVWANLAVLAVAMVLVYRLLLAGSGRVAAGVGGVTFALVFAFGQGVGVGNYNWVTPYAHEFTHGLTLGLVMLACLHRYHATGRTRWLVAGGVACGLAGLAKAEPSAAALAAGAAQVVAGLWMGRAPAGAWARTLGVFVGSVAAPVLVAWLILCGFMPAGLAARGAVGSWAWVFDPRIAGLPFYRGLIGLDDVSGNLRQITIASGVYAAIAVVAVVLGRKLQQRWAAAVVLIVGGAALAAIFFRVNWNDMIRPLPVVLLVALSWAMWTAWKRRPTNAARAALRLAGVVFSLALLPKMLLRAQVFHYGFVLALPGTLVLVAAMFQELPAAVSRWKGNAAVVAAVFAVAWLGGVAAVLYVDGRWFATKAWTIDAGTADAFRGATRALEVQQMQQMVQLASPGGGTLAVFPQGLMLNYLCRRENPTRYVNFMPPEVLAAGEKTILAALAAHPPDLIVIDISTLSGNQFSLDRQYDYGGATLRWIERNYVSVGEATLPPPLPTYLHLVLLQRRHS